MARTVAQALLPRVADSPETGVFAVLDGASIPNLPQELYAHEPDYLCLYRGALDPDLAETAPYLVRLEPGSRFTDWVFDQGWGNHWGIFCTGNCTMRDLRSHFRRFLIVYDPAGKPLYFRYYDPRVLRTFLPTCTPEEATSIFGPLSSYLAEGEDPAVCLRFRQGTGSLVQEFLPLNGADGGTGAAPVAGADLAFAGQDLIR